jgi:hypothetical protein
MSMRPMPWPEVPEQTAVVARAAFRKGTAAIRFAGPSRGAEVGVGMRSPAESASCGMSAGIVGGYS